MCQVPWIAREASRSREGRGDLGWLPGKVAQGAAHRCRRSVGGRDGAGNGARDLSGDPAQLLAWVQLPGSVYPGFSALTGRLKLILPLLPSPSKHLGSPGKHGICPSSVPRYQKPSELSLCHLSHGDGGDREGLSPASRQHNPSPAHHTAF